MLVAVCVIWGLSFIAVKDALTYASPLAFIAIRFILAGVTSVIVLLAGPRLFTWDALLAGIVLGLFLLGGYVSSSERASLDHAFKSAFIQPSAWSLCQS
jgi:drug/metabolite transporter (DMT)-like permease